MVWCSLLTGTLLCITIVVGAFTGLRVHPASWFVLPFLVYAGVNVAFVTPVPWLGWRDWLGWANMAAVFWIVLNGIRHPRARAMLLGTMIALGALGVVLAAYQRFLWPDWLMMSRKQLPQFVGRASGFFGIPNSLAAFFLLLIPPTFAVTLQPGASAARRILAAYLAAIFLFGFALTISRGPWLCLLAALLVWPLCVREKSWEWRVSVFLVATAVVSISALAVYASVPRIKHRFDNLWTELGERSRPIMWSAAWQLVQERPLTGTGAGSYNTLFERYRPAGFNDEPQWAHNEYLNTLSDYGVLGGALLVGSGVGLFLRARRQTARKDTLWMDGIWAPEVTLGLSVGLGAFALSLCFDFHLKIPALGMAFAILAAEWVIRRWPAAENGPPEAGQQLGALFGVLAIAGGTLGLALPTYRAEAARYAAREKIDALARETNPSVQAQRAVLTQATQLLTEACIIDPRNAQAWADKAYATALWARLSPLRTRELGKEAEAMARTAIGISAVVPEFWLRLGVGLDLQGRWAEGGGCFGRAIQLAPTNATAWYYYSYHLNLLPASRALAEAAVQTALRLDPSFRPAIVLQQSLSSR
jgi:O-antigen ligase